MNMPGQISPISSQYRAPLCSQQDYRCNSALRRNLSWPSRYRCSKTNQFELEETAEIEFWFGIQCIAVRCLPMYRCGKKWPFWVTLLGGNGKEKGRVLHATTTVMCFRTGKTPGTASSESSQSQGWLVKLDQLPCGGQDWNCGLCGWYVVWWLLNDTSHNYNR